MKKIILLAAFGCAALVSAKESIKEKNDKTVLMLASTGKVKPLSNFSKVLKKSEAKKEKTTCSVSCSMTYDVEGGTYTVTVSAGNIFSSCERASTRCQEKLEEATR